MAAHSQSIHFSCDGTVEGPKAQTHYTLVKANSDLMLSSNSSLLVDWSSGNPQASQCALLISTVGRKEIYIHLLPGSGSLLLENITQNGKHSFLCTCFAQSQGLLCSKNISTVAGVVHPAPVLQTSDNPSSVSNINMKWLSSGVFGTTVTTCVVLVIYIIYRRWTGNGIDRLRLR
ncbi:hypothetical protein IRJ41_025116 [Triplophysa rosa]|uniref:Uncharacterized protein n=1 Tax=Triplophysa rosa TaxID=992332 RepID=A0A9W7WD85_TRIRA|nr:hypothetical protein IRJ41_025116 [Triplophysa rosa]